MMSLPLREGFEACRVTPQMALCRGGAVIAKGSGRRERRGGSLDWDVQEDAVRSSEVCTPLIPTNKGTHVSHLSHKSIDGQLVVTSHDGASQFSKNKEKTPK